MNKTSIENLKWWMEGLNWCEILPYEDPEKHFRVLTKEIIKAVNMTVKNYKLSKRNL